MSADEKRANGRSTNGDVIEIIVLISPNECTAHQEELIYPSQIGPRVRHLRNHFSFVDSKISMKSGNITRKLLKQKYTKPRS
jgi:hypothetical protein